ncbi:MULTISPECIES: helix-turn-helix transcriptional regulator [Mammaliicoccus]|uniref:helix-turn-helix transcriptional regulator n=1 Tax=Mammaliicoccus TaxID=2803850 RepID=UPI000E6A73CF|nr:MULTISPECIES: YafY family protein [Mammaliicoccus]QQT15318.1 YafY family transcriptional regulator [Mammaliicoccus vitulinus]QQY19381.1 YafY family transcriptional regulator [Mammaliicoccus vitulinus]RIN14383.1 YafY family transcriptional regulator [Mammaliicoccus vitulinus]RIN20451.1 YafY family transcriptional regulator [Mammaliicoccus vitulinus]RTX83183.1 YafY family transcriptional regulator [Mammaliicoccus vitulinus]
MKISRLVSIIMILLERGRVSAQELSNIFEVSTRTIYRDIDAINIAGIPIVSTPGVNGGIEIMEKYKVDKSVFSTEEISTILTGLSSLTNFVGNEELVNAIVKMKSFIPNDKTEEIAFKTEQILIDLTQWVGYRNLQSYLELMKISIARKKIISFDYIDLHGNKSYRKVEAYQIILKGSQWYFYGYCCYRNDFRLFKLSRISNLKLENEAFTPRKFQKATLEFSDILKAKQITIKLRIHKLIIDRVLDFCKYEDCLSDGNDHYIVNFPFIENDYYYNMILSFGNKCECLWPLNVRSQVKQKIEQLANLYSNEN